MAKIDLDKIIAESLAGSGNEAEFMALAVLKIVENLVGVDYDEQIGKSFFRGRC